MSSSRTDASVDPLTHQALERWDAFRSSRTAGADVVLPPEFSDDALAASVTAKYGTELRYTASTAKWHAWNGVRWEEDTTLAVFDRIRRLCREAAAAQQKSHIAKALTSAKTVAAVEVLARSDRVHATKAEAWDADRWLLNTPVGVIDLRTGTIRVAVPEDLLTKVTATGPGELAPRWRAFLERVTGGDEERQTYLQRVAGYCLTGSTRAQAFFFFLGTGGNGKGVFVNTLTHVLGDYACVAAAETFTISRTDRHPTELARLRGARLVVAQEPPASRGWDDSRIKSITGGDPISARFMRGDFFTYLPQFKLVVVGNHAPHLQSVNEAMRRRLHLVPFTETIAPDERVEDLEEQLRAEAPGILSWAIEGCLAWQREGLCAPASVRDATEDYFAGEDAFQLWLDEYCELRPGYSEAVGSLFSSWQTWCKATREDPGSEKAFATQLQGHGFISGRARDRKRTRMYAGLRLTPMQPHLLDRHDDVG